MSFSNDVAALIKSISIFGSLVLAFFIRSEATAADDLYAILRERLVEDRIASAGVKDSRVLDAIRNTERHEFVPKSQRERAYLDMALPIGGSQTISSPFTVASMTEAIEPESTDKVLEIGTGSGYQAAVLSPLVEHVYSIEIVDELGRKAAETLTRLGYENVSTRIGDGFLGWPDAAPFDKIIVTCSPESVPLPLIEQLREGGLMIIPVGQRYQQTLYRMQKVDGKLVRQALHPTLFVPMTGEAEEGRQQLPDPTNPVVVNGNFETLPSQKQSSIEDFVPGWYYGRQVRQVTPASESDSGGTQSSSGSPRATVPEGETFVRFENETSGLSSHLLQGIAIDGREVSMIRLSGRVQVEDVKIGPDPESLPMIAISLYDEQRRDLGAYWIGPFRGTRSWRDVSRLVRIPHQTREAILRIGLFGATGKAEFDAVAIEKVD
ncbi:protein-L-isoaspartate O-methyltransferase [Rhodopirellula maiorica SM1]|uniref:Protein-L-isoaspartate O-methyltransferase n=1 Tax=Rhodopirellula maiorica SM1 TaxID=1265738 RepID=M5RQN6_9BACT|nr:protein-L-isoaspartate(D-aspartate) O-methyltransferase [Rhodopirellula maiorica]EMI17697.1 protein-L-isoaspartate O-methyltransferase [Rhodopirellula maiorica SM1]